MTPDPTVPSSLTATNQDLFKKRVKGPCTQLRFADLLDAIIEQKGGDAKNYLFSKHHCIEKYTPTYQEENAHDFVDFDNLDDSTSSSLPVATPPISEASAETMDTSPDTDAMVDIAKTFATPSAAEPAIANAASTSDSSSVTKPSPDAPSPSKMLKPLSKDIAIVPEVVSDTDTSHNIPTLASICEEEESPSPKKHKKKEKATIVKRKLDDDTSNAVEKPPKRAKSDTTNVTILPTCILTTEEEEQPVKSKKATKQPPPEESDDDDSSEESGESEPEDGEDIGVSDNESEEEDNGEDEEEEDDENEEDDEDEDESESDDSEEESDDESSRKRKGASKKKKKPEKLNPKIFPTTEKRTRRPTADPYMDSLQEELETKKDTKKYAALREHTSNTLKRTFEEANVVSDDDSEDDDIPQKDELDGMAKKKLKKVKIDLDIEQIQKPKTPAQIYAQEIKRAAKVWFSVSVLKIGCKDQFDEIKTLADTLPATRPSDAQMAAWQDKHWIAYCYNFVEAGIHSAITNFHAATRNTDVALLIGALNGLHSLNIQKAPNSKNTPSTCFITGQECSSRRMKMLQLHGVTYYFINTWESMLKILHFIINIDRFLYEYTINLVRHTSCFTCADSTLTARALNSAFEGTMNQSIAACVEQGVSAINKAVKLIEDNRTPVSV